MEITDCETRHVSDLLDLMAAFNLESGYFFVRENGEQLVIQLLQNPTLGKIWLLQDRENEHKTVGYVAICYCFSFEHGGRDAFVDEIYLMPDYRRKGLGGKLLRYILTQLPVLGIRALHLEVEDENASARQLYEKIGFFATTRRLMTCKP